MTDLIIRKANSYEDAVLISKHMSEIWNDPVDDAYYQNMHEHINQYNNGYIIGYLDDQPVCSSIAFPIKHIPSIDEINTSSIFDCLFHGGKHYYVHTIQVMEKYRNKGFGVSLLNHHINNAKLNNHRYVIGMAIEQQLAFWRKCGLTEFGFFFLYKHYGKFKWTKMKI